MTQEDKELLLRDLCARLPYGVIIQEYNEEYGYADNALNTIGIGYFSIHEACIEGTWINHIENVRPYLRPMSSMTKKEKNSIDDLLEKIYKMPPVGHIHVAMITDWLLERHFDIHDLISKGLALEAPEGMYGLNE